MFQRQGAQGKEWAPTFTIHFSSREHKYELDFKSDGEFKELIDTLSDKINKPVESFVWLDTQVETNKTKRVDGKKPFDDLINGLRAKLVSGLDPRTRERLEDLDKKRKEKSLTEKEEKELHKELFIKQDIILKLKEKSEQEDEYERVRREQERQRGIEKAQERARLDAQTAGEHLRSITLRFPLEKNSAGRAMEVTVAYGCSWDVLTDALQNVFRRTVHFRYLSEQKAWVDVRSAAAFDTFRKEKALEWLAQAAPSAVADVHLLLFGTGGFPLMESLEDISLLSSTHQVIKDRMRLMQCVARGATSLESAAQDARAVVQNTQGLDAALDESDDLGRTPLHLAAKQGLLPLTQSMLSAYKEARERMVAARDHLGRTPLHEAKDEHVCVALLKARADPAARDKGGATPLHTVTDPAVAASLLVARRHGAEVDADANARDKSGLTPIMVHAGRGERHLNMLTFLAQPDRAGALLASEDAGARLDLLAVDRFGRTVLHHAAACNNWLALQQLVNTGLVDVNARDEFGMTPMHVAAQGDHFKAVSYLINEVSDCSLLDKADRAPVDLAKSDSTKRLLAQSLRPDRRSARHVKGSSAK